MYHRITFGLVIIIVILQSSIALIIEEYVQPTTFKNVKINLISQTLKTKSTLYVQSGNSLRDFIIGKGIDTVRINNEVIPTLYENSVSNIRNVAVFDLSSNEMQGIEEGAFGNLGLVQALNLSSNQIRVIRSDVFTNIDVRFLFLGHNNIFRIEDGAFRDSNQLYFIDLSFNRIRKWDWRWFSGSGVKGINMRHNFLEHLPEDSFKFIDNLNIPDHHRILHQLLFSNNEIRFIDRLSLPRLKKLVFLDLSHNNLQTIEVGTFDNIESLDKIDLSFNYLVYLGRNLFKRTNVGYVNLKSNYLAFISFDMAPLIDLDMNPLNSKATKEWIEWKKNRGHLIASSGLADYR